VSTELNTALIGDTDAGATRVIAELGALATKPRELKAGETYAIPDGDGGVKFQKVDDLPANPLRIKSARTVSDVTSFVDYVNRHGNGNTEVWADRAHSTVVAIIDGHASVDSDGLGRPGYEAHKVTLVLEHTPSWLAWAKFDRKLISQETFAEHIEENTLDVLAPDSATMLEIAQSFQATRGVDFGQTTRLSNGETSIKYSESLDGKAGRKGDLVIPDEFTLGLIPYLGGTGHKVQAKFRWRLREAELSLGYNLVRADLILEEAFTDVLAVVTASITPPLFYGRP
jgi:uncharacterized protein YfdQ (DUF2303 family)